MRARWQRGVAAIELALLVSAGFFAVPCLLALGAAAWHYTVMQKAVYGAARYMAALPRQDMTSQAAADQAVATATAMMADTVAAARMPPLATVQIVCQPQRCGYATAPSTVMVSAALVFRVDSWDLFTIDLLGSGGLPLSVTVTMRYGD